MVISNRVVRACDSIMAMERGERKSVDNGAQIRFLVIGTGGTHEIKRTERRNHRARRLQAIYTVISEVQDNNDA